MPKTTKIETTNLSIPVYTLAGKEAGNLSLPEALFGVEVKTALLAQAMRVYMTNQKAHWSNTKTRGEVTGSTRKIYRQKGTGGARHGSITAPIFVGGGISLGPKYRKTVLDLPKKMKDRALIYSLSQKAKDAEVKGLEGLEKASGKTKEIVALLKGLKTDKTKKSSLLIIGDKNDMVVRAVRNLENVEVLPASLVNAFEVVRHESLLLTKEAVDKLQERLTEKSPAPKTTEEAIKPTPRKRATK